MTKHYPGKTEMLELLKQRGISDEQVLKAMEKIRREDFLSEPFKLRAYDDCALPIGHEQTISQPFTVAVMTQFLNFKRGDKILEIGTGSGFQAAVLYEMGARVFTIERNLELHKKAKEYFSKNNLSVISKYGDGTIGWIEHAPFNGIIVTAGAPIVSESLKNQLSENGKLIIPVGKYSEQDILIIEKKENNFITKTIPGFKFVPLVGKEGWEK